MTARSETRSTSPARSPALRSPSSTPAANSQGRKRASFSEKAYQDLRTRILDNTMPSGEQFTEKELASLLEMSRTPVREAMLRLAKEGLVEVKPRHGMRIKPVSVNDVREIYEVLTSLESSAAALAAERQDHGDHIDRMREAILEMDKALKHEDRRSWASADERFHTLLVDAAGNKRISNLVKTFFDQSHRVRMLTLFLRPMPVNSNRDHEAVVDAVAAHDSKRARELHYGHRERSGRMLVELLIRHGLTQL